MRARPGTFHRENARLSIAFGRGLHFCIGFNLAKLVARYVIEAALTHLPGLRLNSERAAEPRGFEFHRLERLDVLWNA